MSTFHSAVKVKNLQRNKNLKEKSYSMVLLAETKSQQTNCSINTSWCGSRILEEIKDQDKRNTYPRMWNFGATRLWWRPYSFKYYLKYSSLAKIKLSYSFSYIIE